MAHLHVLIGSVRIAVPDEGALRFPVAPSEARIEIAWTPAGLLMTTTQMAEGSLRGAFAVTARTALLRSGTIISIGHELAEVVIDDEDLLTRATDFEGWSVRGIDALSVGHHVVIRSGEYGTLVVQDAAWPSAWLNVFRLQIADNNVIQQPTIEDRNHRWVPLRNRVDIGILRQMAQRRDDDLLPRLVSHAKQGVVFEPLSGMSWFHILVRLSDEEREPESPLRYSVARAILCAMLSAESAPPPHIQSVILTWDGAVHVVRRPLLGRAPAWPRIERALSRSLQRLRQRSTDAFLDWIEWLDEHLLSVIDHQDIERFRPDDTDAEEIEISSEQECFHSTLKYVMTSEDGQMATADGRGLSRAEIAALMRGLFPEEWRIEARRREQLAML